jgi:hypothetical protein
VEVGPLPGHGRNYSVKSYRHFLACSDYEKDCLNA